MKDNIFNNNEILKGKVQLLASEIEKSKSLDTKDNSENSRSDCIDDLKSCNSGDYYLSDANNENYDFGCGINDGEIRRNNQKSIKEYVDKFSRNNTGTKEEDSRNNFIDKKYESRKFSNMYNNLEMNSKESRMDESVVNDRENGSVKHIKKKLLDNEQNKFKNIELINNKIKKLNLDEIFEKNRLADDEIKRHNFQKEAQDGIKKFNKNHEYVNSSDKNKRNIFFNNNNKLTLNKQPNYGLQIRENDEIESKQDDGNCSDTYLTENIYSRPEIDKFLHPQISTREKEDMNHSFFEKNNANAKYQKIKTDPMINKRRESIMSQYLLDEMALILSKEGNEQLKTTKNPNSKYCGPETSMESYLNNSGKTNYLKGGSNFKNNNFSNSGYNYYRQNDKSSTPVNNYSSEKRNCKLKSNQESYIPDKSNKIFNNNLDETAYKCENSCNNSFLNESQEMLNDFERNTPYKKLILKNFNNKLYNKSPNSSSISMKTGKIRNNYSNKEQSPAFKYFETPNSIQCEIIQSKTNNNTDQKNLNSDHKIILNKSRIPNSANLNKINDDDRISKLKTDKMTIKDYNKQYFSLNRTNPVIENVNSCVDKNKENSHEKQNNSVFNLKKDMINPQNYKDSGFLQSKIITQDNKNNYSSSDCDIDNSFIVRSSSSMTNEEDSSADTTIKNDSTIQLSSSVDKKKIDYMNKIDKYLLSRGSNPNKTNLDKSKSNKGLIFVNKIAPSNIKVNNKNYKNIKDENFYTLKTNPPPRKRLDIMSITLTEYKNSKSFLSKENSGISSTSLFSADLHEKKNSDSKKELKQQKKSTIKNHNKKSAIIKDSSNNSVDIKKSKLDSKPNQAKQNEQRETSEKNKISGLLDEIQKPLLKKNKKQENENITKNNTTNLNKITSFPTKEKEASSFVDLYSKYTEELKKTKKYDFEHQYTTQKMFEKEQMNTIGNREHVFSHINQKNILLETKLKSIKIKNTRFILHNEKQTTVFLFEIKTQTKEWVIQKSLEDIYELLDSLNILHDKQINKFAKNMKYFELLDSVNTILDQIKHKYELCLDNQYFFQKFILFQSQNHYKTCMDLYLVNHKDKLSFCAVYMAENVLVMNEINARKGIYGNKKKSMVVLKLTSRSLKARIVDDHFSGLNGIELIDKDDRWLLMSPEVRLTSGLYQNIKLHLDENLSTGK